MTRKRVGGSSDCWEAFLQARKRLLDAWTAEGVAPADQLWRLQVDATQLELIRQHVPTGHDRQLRIERLSEDLDAARAARQAELDAFLAGPPDVLLDALLVEGRCPLDGFSLKRRRRHPVEGRLSELYCRCGFTFGLG